MAKAKNMQTITVRDVGAVRSAEFPYDPEGGVVEFRGAQGVGKSTMLRAVELAATGKGKLPIRDKARSGEIEAFGMVVKIGARTTRTGEPEVISMEGRFSLADLVDPGIAKPESADAARIKALVQLSGVEADIGLFTATLGELGADWLHTDTIEAPDLLSMAERLKRELEGLARATEGKADNARGRVQALKKAAESDEIMPAAEWTAETAQAELERCIATLAESRQRLADNKRRRQKSDEARAFLEKATAEYTGQTVEDAALLLEAEKKVAAARAAIVADLRAELAAAEKSLHEANMAAERAATQHLRAKEHFGLVDQWRKQIADDLPDDDGLAELVETNGIAVEESRKLVANVAIRDKMATHLAEAKKAAKEAAEEERRAVVLRDAAKATDQVLSDAVARLGTKLYVEGGRLMVDTEARGATYFGELSDGERTRIVIEIAIEEAAKLAGDGRLGIFVIPQAMWSELQPANRAWVRDKCKEKRVLAYAAVATDDPELTAEVL